MRSPGATSRSASGEARQRQNEATIAARMSLGIPMRYYISQYQRFQRYAYALRTLPPRLPRELPAQQSSPGDLFPAGLRCLKASAACATTTMAYRPQPACLPAPTRLPAPWLFGLRLSALVDQAIRNSVLLAKPTRASPTPAASGSRRAAPASGSEELVAAWLSSATRAARRGGKALSANRGRRNAAPVDAQPVQQHRTRSAQRYDAPGGPLPARGLHQRFTNQAEGQSISPLLAKLTRSPPNAWR
jgi:hypothetical protein